MDAARFREIVTDSVARMLGGSVSGPVTPSKQKRQVAYHGPTRLGLKPTSDSPFHLLLERSQNFEEAEKSLAECYLHELQGISGAAAAHFDDLLTALPRRVVGKHLNGSSSFVHALELLERWSAQTYEGRRIVASIGFVPSNGSGENIRSVLDEPFAPVISNGIDTLLVFGANDLMEGYQELTPGAPSPRFAPDRLREIAAWTSQDSDRLALVLNRHGEVLVLQDGLLAFARRSGTWTHYIHEPIVKQIGFPRKAPDIREAIYSSCLDVSFARTGGCIGVLKQAAGIPASISPEDQIALQRSAKTRFLHLMVGAPFHTLGRRTRLELLALDGAVVLDHQGRVVAAGAILNVAGGGRGGGRRAAAEELSRHGVGIKISADGPITGIINGDEVLQC